MPDLVRSAGFSAGVPAGVFIGFFMWFDVCLFMRYFKTAYELAGTFVSGLLFHQSTTAISSKFSVYGLPCTGDSAGA